MAGGWELGSLLQWRLRYWLPSSLPKVGLTESQEWGHSQIFKNGNQDPCSCDLSQAHLARPGLRFPVCGLESSQGPCCAIWVRTKFLPPFPFLLLSPSFLVLSLFIAYHILLLITPRIGEGAFCPVVRTEPDAESPAQMLCLGKAACLLHVPPCGLPTPLLHRPPRPTPLTAPFPFLHG